MPHSVWDRKHEHITERPQPAWNTGGHSLTSIRLDEGRDAGPAFGEFALLQAPLMSPTALASIPSPFDDPRKRSATPSRHFSVPTCGRRTISGNRSGKMSATWRRIILRNWSAQTTTEWKRSRRPSPHFLGAVVLKHTPTAAKDINQREVIDGQQRAYLQGFAERSDGFVVVTSLGPTSCPKDPATV